MFWDLSELIIKVSAVLNMNMIIYSPEARGKLLLKATHGDIGSSPEPGKSIRRMMADTFF